ncbi:hypothetical protein [Desulfosporosinus nitroreducens]|uniref:hypothetical protein n=1 Tax=Desulfosporosinus nitroreducens TaxID=2018668 RepID=UPI00207D5189|nr:hypothetical protein [Desulfosporosinus nitroreducens]MCO1604749.1 hypothetical protein [Desulfosporosinus nitroreducens]
MATIVVHKVTGKHYALVGTGYSFFKDSRPSVLGGVLFPHQEEGESMRAAISDEYGVIRWVQTNEIEVINIDGVRIGEILEPYQNSCLSTKSKSDSLGDCCPACGIGVSAQDKECPSCGLLLMD